MKFYDVLREKNVEIEPDRVDVIAIWDSDGSVMILTKVFSEWSYKEPVTVYVGRCFENALAMRAQMYAKITGSRQKEEKEKSAQVREHFASASQKLQDQDTTKMPGSQAGGDESGGETNVRQDNYRQ